MSQILFFSLTSLFFMNPPDELDFSKMEWINGDFTMPYRLVKPDTVAGQVYPLVIFLHGAGERGNDNEKQLKHGVREFAKSDIQAKFPCFVLAPQCAENERWVEVDWTLKKSSAPKNPSRHLEAVHDLITSMTKDYPIDTNRIYITGMSMGGFGTWDAITRYPELFAAAVPVCGGGDTHQVSLIKNLPIWVFHGKKDNVVNVCRSRDMVHALYPINHSVVYSEYPDVEHNAWDYAYNTPELFEWLFKQTKAK
jgi:predicted peptidase